jgi:ferredoxin
MSAQAGMEIHVDSGKCLAYGTCVGLAPDHFDLPRGAKTVILLKRMIDADEIADIEEAVRSCPARALSLQPVRS